jgi:hypothetical protein
VRVGSRAVRKEFHTKHLLSFFVLYGL